MRPAAPPTSFATPEDFAAWLADHHDSASELWIRMFKKGSGTPSVDWNDCVVQSLAWGWIDGRRASWDEVSFVQRFTPRREGSAWSTKNRAHVERLLAEGRMQPSGFRHVQAAKADGRWDTTYAGSKDMVLPADFLAALAENPAAKAGFESLPRADVFAVYYRLHTAKRPDTRSKRLASMIGQLSRGEGIR